MATRKTPKKPAAKKPAKRTPKKTPKKRANPNPAKRPLTVRQERFCEILVAGESATQAYVKAGYKVTAADARKHAARLMTKDGVKARIAVLRKPQTRKALLTKDEQREVCRAIAMNEGGSPMTRLRAIEVDAKLAGFFAPDQVVVDTGPNELASLKERAERVAGILSIANRRPDPK